MHVTGIRPRRVAVGMLLGLGLCVYGIRTVTRVGGVEVLARGAHRLMAREVISRMEDAPFTYPPFAALGATPLAQLSLPLAKILWYAANVGLAAGAVAASRALAGCGWRAAALGTLLSAQGILAVFENQAYDLFVFGWTVAGIWGVARGRPLLGGAAIGIAAALKASPILYVPALALLGCWRAAGAAGAAGLACSILPDVLFGWPAGGRPHLVDWADKVLVSHTLTPWYGWDELNQALWAALYRWCSAKSVSMVQVGHLSDPAFRVLVGLSTATLAAAAGLALWRLGRRGGAEARTLGLALVGPLMLLVSAMSSKSHFCAMLLPNILVCARAATFPRFLRWGWGIAVLLLGGISGRDLYGERLAKLGYHAGDVTLSALLTFWMLLWLARNIPPRARDDPSHPRGPAGTP